MGILRLRNMSFRDEQYNTTLSMKSQYDFGIFV